MQELRLTMFGRVVILVAMSFCFALCGCVAGNGMAEKAQKDVEANSQLPMKYKDYNIVFVSFDAVQAAHVHSLGYQKDITPTIDALAKEGFNFTNNMVVSSWTVPSAMSWFTGVYPSEHKLLNKFVIFDPPNNNKISKMKELAPNIVTLAEILKKDGYATAGFTGDAGMSGVFGYSQGFDVYFDKVKFGGMDQSVPKAMEWVKENKDKKFFLLLHGYDSHGQYEPPQGFDYRFVDQGYDRKYSGSKEEQEALREEGLEKGQVTLRDEDVRFWRAIYDEKINRADAWFKIFMNEMESLGLKEKTLFVVTSDHGTEFYEHKRFDHGFSLYDELIHTPLVVKLPGRTDGKVINDQISSINVLPTILDLLAVEVPDNVKKQMRVTSLVPALQGQPMTEDVYSETDYRLYTYKRAVQTKDKWKFIYTMESKSRELYNLNTDPGETKNLIDVEPKRAYELEQKLFAYFKSIGHDLTARRWEPGMSPVYDSQGKASHKK